MNPFGICGIGLILNLQARSRSAGLGACSPVNGNGPFVKSNDERHYLWRAVDHESEVLESCVTRRRDKKAALKFMKKAMRRYGSPNEIVTDKLRS